MHTLFIGDYKANTCPSNINKNLKEYLPIGLASIEALLVDVNYWFPKCWCYLHYAIYLTNGYY
mgnify:CR=1 FL=1